MNKILVTGATGFVGKTLCRALLDRGATVVGVDALDSNASIDFPSAGEASDNDVSKYSLHLIDFEKHGVNSLLDGVDTIFHIADRATDNIRESSARNLVHFNKPDCASSTESLVKSLRDVKHPVRLVHVSSHLIYGQNAVAPVLETERCSRKNGRARSLRRAENLALGCSNELVSAICVRLFPVYGPMEPSSSRTRRLINQILNNETIVVAGQGTEVADLTYIDDAVAGLVVAGENRLNGMTVNLGGGARVSQLEYLDYLRDLNGGVIKLRFSSESRGKWHTPLASLSLATKVLGFKPVVGFMEGLANEFDWIRGGVMSLTESRSVGHSVLK